MVLAVLPPNASGQSPQVRATWEAPITGSPVVTYELEVLVDGVRHLFVTSETTSYVFAPGTFEPSVAYIARVRGVDAQGRTGPWSLPSEPYVHDAGPPGLCGPIQWTED